MHIYCMCHEILTKYKNEVDNDVRPLLTTPPQQAETGHIVRSSSAQAQKILAPLWSFTSILKCSFPGNSSYRLHSVRLKLCK